MRYNSSDMIPYTPVSLAGQVSPVDTMVSNHVGETQDPPGTAALALVHTTPDKCRRDEWSENGVLCLLEAYEAKWLIRNQAKLKGSDWEEIAHQVSIGAKAIKTPNQCKNKIESMKKRYRVESAISRQPSSTSSWHFYARMDSLLKGKTNCSAQPKTENNIDLQAIPEVEVNVDAEGNFQESNQNDGSNTLPMLVSNGIGKNINGDDNNRREDQEDTASDVSAPRSKRVIAEEGREKDDANLFKRKKYNGNEIAESIKLLAQTMLKIEEARLEMYTDAERIRAEAEIKRGELELKRIEIIAQTQLQIAKLFSKQFLKSGSNKSTSSSLEAEADVLPASDGKDK